PSPAVCGVFLSGTPVQAFSDFSDLRATCPRGPGVCCVWTWPAGAVAAPQPALGSGPLRLGIVVGLFLLEDPVPLFPARRDLSSGELLFLSRGDPGGDVAKRGAPSRPAAFAHHRGLHEADGGLFWWRLVPAQSGMDHLCSLHWNQCSGTGRRMQ